MHWFFIVMAIIVISPLEVHVSYSYQPNDCSSSQSNDRSIQHTANSTNVQTKHIVVIDRESEQKGHDFIYLYISAGLDHRTAHTNDVIS